MKKPHKIFAWPLIYGLVLAACTGYILLDSFVIEHSYQVVPSNTAYVSDSTTTTSSTATAAAATLETDSSNATQPTATATTYKSSDITINLTTYHEYDTEIYVADITLQNAQSLQTAFADDTYGRNIKETTSTIAAAHNAILAINGDFYSARDGYVIRNGVLYRSTAAGADQQDLVIYADGTFKIIQEGEISAAELLADGAQQVLSFGPGLLVDGQITVDTTTEVDRAKSSNPRTAIGEISPLHYVMVVADGRTNESAGLSLYQLAEFMQKLNVTTAYTLDGGGSSTMYFNGKVINKPTTNGNNIEERSVSDIVYIK